MRKTYNLKDVNIGKLHDAVNLLAIDGFAGISIDTGIHMEFPDRESLTKTEQKKLDTLMESYVDPIYIEDVRKMREPLLEEADWRFNKAVDSDDQQMVDAIKLYRNQLRDMTKQELNNLIWPNKPWEQ
jgi:hypothetical protein